MRILSLCIGVLLAAPVAMANVLTLEPGSRKIESVTVAQSATWASPAGEVKLAALGAGLRQKHVLFSDVNVYVAQIFADPTNKLVRTPEAALASLESVQHAAVHLTFLRFVGAETVQSSFKDALIANEVNVSAPDIKKFLSAVTNGGDANDGKSMTMVLERKADGSEVVIYEDTQGNATPVVGGKGFVTAILSIWLGESADPGLAELKKQILAGN